MSSFVFQVSPGVVAREIDLTTGVPFTSVTDGAFVGRFRWGPVREAVLVPSEDVLESTFQSPKNDVSAVDFMVASSFLSYSDKLKVVRVVDEYDAVNNTNGAVNAYSYLVPNFGQSPTIPTNNIDILNDDDYADWRDAGFSGETAEYLAKWVGEIGNTLKVSHCPGDTGYFFTFPGTFDFQGRDGTTTVAKKTITYNGAEDLRDYFNAGDFWVWDDRRFKVESIPTASSLVLEKALDDPGQNGVTGAREWEFNQIFDSAPAENEFHVVVIDNDGSWTGDPGSILEKHGYMSTVQGTKYADGRNAYFVDVLEKSAFIWYGGVTPTTDANAIKNKNYLFSGGRDGLTTGTANVSISAWLDGWDVFSNPEEVDASLLIHNGDEDETVRNYIISNIAETRKDAIAFFSPSLTSVTDTKPAVKIIEDRAKLPSTSYAVMDNNWKRMYDRYNEVYRWVPLCGDFAGLCARTDETNDPWFSPAGNTRGEVKNAGKLAWSAGKGDRNELYKYGVNSYLKRQSGGTVLWGDKTLLARESAFSRVNVRRLFIVLEKAISIFAENSLFEFNDEFTRARFVGAVQPYLRNVRARRGVTDFLVICDETNNTGVVIDSHNFVGDIYIKPARSINFITLNFIATPTGVEFSEVVQTA